MEKEKTRYNDEELEEFKNINHIVLDTEETRELFSKINELGAQGELDTLDIQDESYEPYIYDSEHHILTKYILILIAQ
jgi:hypothetical protein